MARAKTTPPDVDTDGDGIMAGVSEDAYTADEDVPAPVEKDA